MDRVGCTTRMRGIHTRESAVQNWREKHYRKAYLGFPNVDPVHLFSL